MKAIIAGSKTFDNYPYFKAKVEDFLFRHRHEELEYIITGGDPGTEALADRFAKEFEIPLKTFLPDYETFAEEAEIIRDTQIVDDGSIMLVFYDGVSTGHPRKQDQAKKKGIITEVIDYSKP